MRQPLRYANGYGRRGRKVWLSGEGWGDLFLDLDPERGIAAGERWERALNEAARRCEAVLFLISKAGLGSAWCKNELNLARRLNKWLFGILIEEGLAVGDLPADVTSKWQVINLAAGSDHKQFPVTLPVTGEPATPTFSREGLARLKSGLQRAGLAASWVTWPPKDALPLLAFTLERLYDEYHATGHIRLAHDETLGRIGGSIEAAIERSFKAADSDARIPRDSRPIWPRIRARRQSSQRTRRCDRTQSTAGQSGSHRQRS